MANIEGNVGSKILFENDNIIVWDFELKPGEETPIHRHQHSYMWYAIQGAPLDCEDSEGNDLGIFDVPTGSVFHIHCDGDTLEVMSELSKGVRFPVTHKAKNVGEQTYREILIEFKNQDGGNPFISQAQG